MRLESKIGRWHGQERDSQIGSQKKFDRASRGREHPSNGRARKRRRLLNVVLKNPGRKDRRQGKISGCEAKSWKLEGTWREVCIRHYLATQLTKHRGAETRAEVLGVSFGPGAEAAGPLHPRPERPGLEEGRAGPKGE
jgi:hypothetical protein